MLDLEVNPEQSLSAERWEFILGMHFSQAVAIIQHQIGTIRGVQIIYSDSVPLETDLIINLTNDGIKLCFDPIYQRLKMIEVYNMKLVKLKYSGLTFNSSEVLPTIEQIDHSFGATHPGLYNSERQVLSLNFPGLTFYFPLDPKYQACLEKGVGSVKLMGFQSPVVSRLVIFAGSVNNELRSPPMPLTCMHNLVYLDSLQVLREHDCTKGLHLLLYTDDGRSRHPASKQNFLVDLYFGSTCQEVSSNLGAPSKIFFKAEDKMKIHNARARRATERSDYFFNYFTLGLDILFDAKTQQAKKFVLHTNFPGHYNFNMYHRCDFELPITIPRHPSDSSQLVDLPSNVTVQSVTLWSNLSNCLKVKGRPVVLHRSSSTNTCNPFGSTFCHAYQDIIFEVMPNNHIASVTLFESEASA